MTKQFFTVFLLALLFVACNDDNSPPSTSINKIMPLGASRVEGNRPDFESYRYELWKRLVDSGKDFDYVGTENDRANYPDYSGLNFDNDHEGRGGWTSEQILNGIDEWLNQGDIPDIVLFSSPGGNDGLNGQSYNIAVDNVNQIIDKLQTANPNVTIIIEQMAPALSSAMTPELSTFMSQMNAEVQNIATNQTTATSQILTVDMVSGFNDSYLADDVHYNEAGAVFIAERYYDVLDDILK